MKELVDGIQLGADTSGVTATAGDVLSGKITYNSAGQQITGTMTNNGAVSKVLSRTSTSYTIPAGYHNGSGKVYITTENKTVTPSSSAQTVYPSTNKVFGTVTVSAKGSGLEVVSHKETGYAYAIDFEDEVVGSLSYIIIIFGEDQGTIAQWSEIGYGDGQRSWGETCVGYGTSSTMTFIGCDPISGSFSKNYSNAVGTGEFDEGYLMVYVNYTHSTETEGYNQWDTTRSNGSSYATVTAVNSQ